MEIEKLNQKAEIRACGLQLQVTNGHGNPIALFPGALERIRTGVGLTCEKGELVHVSLPRAMAEGGVHLMAPDLVSAANAEEIVLSVINRSGFVRQINPGEVLCVLTAITVNPINRPAPVKDEEPKPKRKAS